MLACSDNMAPRFALDKRCSSPIQETAVRSSSKDPNMTTEARREAHARTQPRGIYTHVRTQKERDILEDPKINFSRPLEMASQELLLNFTNP